jgi:hypothetical protein
VQLTKSDGEWIHVLLETIPKIPEDELGFPAGNEKATPWYKTKVVCFDDFCIHLPDPLPRHALEVLPSLKWDHVNAMRRGAKLDEIHESIRSCGRVLELRKGHFVHREGRFEDLKLVAKPVQG